MCVFPYHNRQTLRGSSGSLLETRALVCPGTQTLPSSRYRGKQAGRHVLTEHDILISDETTKIADLLSYQDNGTDIAFDVLITGNPDLAKPVSEDLPAPRTCSCTPPRGP